MFIRKKILKFLALTPVIASTVWSTTACGASNQFLTQQYLVKFDGELDKDGYLKSGQNGTPHYYRINTQNSKNNYVETDYEGKPEAAKNVHDLVGLIAIYAQIAKFVTSMSTVLVNYAHENIGVPELLGISFTNETKGGKVTSLSGDFLFAASSSFASGKRSDNFAFGLATLRFDIEAWDGTKSRTDLMQWTDSLCHGGSFDEDQKKTIADDLSKHAFLKHFLVENISILYKFYKFGRSSPSPYYDSKSSCVSISKHSSSDELKKFTNQIATPFDRTCCSPKLKYQALSFDPKSTNYADGFVLRMQPLVTVFSYINDTDQDAKKQSNNDDKKSGINLRALPPFSPNIFPQTMWDNWFRSVTWENKENVSEKLKPQKFAGTENVDTLVKNIKANSFFNRNDSKDEPEKKENKDYQTLINGISSMTSDLAEFASQIDKFHPHPDEKIKLKKGSFFSGKTFRDFVKYFFNKANKDDKDIDNDIINVVTNSSPRNPKSDFPYFGELINK